MSDVNVKVTKKRLVLPTKLIQLGDYQETIWRWMETVESCHGLPPKDSTEGGEADISEES